MRPRPREDAVLYRPRRLRRTAALRDLTAEVRLAPANLIQPHFVVEGTDRDEPISSMPGIGHQSIDRLLECQSNISRSRAFSPELSPSVPNRSSKMYR